MWLHILDQGVTMCARGSQEYESICNVLSELLRQYLTKTATKEQELQGSHGRRWF